MSVKMSTLVKLNSVRQNVVVELEKSYSNTDWVNEVYDAVNDAFFEKAAKILEPYSPLLAKRMLTGAY